MLRQAFCLLSVAALAVSANNYGGYTVGPDTNLIFNFEQIRRDQPPQIEIREENINKYRNRPRTTTPVPVMSYPIDNGDMSPMLPPNPVDYTAPQWNSVQKAPEYVGPVQNWKSVPAPPNFPHWESLSSMAATNPANYEAPLPQQPIVVPPTPVHHYIPSVAPTMYTTTMAPMREHTRMMPRTNAAGSRGSHRFNWDEPVEMEQMTTMAGPGVTTRGPPPPVPTLSPWHDGFGK